mmetsp:Transcript_22958/g.34029  ORF Transcript_22958/g.34029 Transcript_22958/m.34029 type:complete len:102 (-) Transcript_22958:364-669(-)
MHHLSSNVTSLQSLASIDQSQASSTAVRVLMSMHFSQATHKYLPKNQNELEKEHAPSKIFSLVQHCSIWMWIMNELKLAAIQFSNNYMPKVTSWRFPSQTT